MPQPPKPTTPLLKNTASAPVIFFDGAPAYGTVNGIVEIELAARILIPKPDNSVAVDPVCMAHLRCSLQAASNLHAALGKALEMAAGSNGKPN